MFGCHRNVLRVWSIVLSVVVRTLMYIILILKCLELSKVYRIASRLELMNSVLIHSQLTRMYYFVAILFISHIHILIKRLKCLKLKTKSTISSKNRFLFFILHYILPIFSAIYLALVLVFLSAH